MIKLIATDLDGTFVDNEKNVPEKNYKIINQLIDKNIIFIPTSGRDYPSMKEILGDRIKKANYYSCLNGAKIFKNEKIIYSIKIPKDICNEIIKKGLELGINYSATSGFNVCYSQLDTEYYGEFKNNNSNYNFYSNEKYNNLKIFDFEKIVFFGENEKLEEIKTFVLNNFKGQVNIFFSGNGIIDIVNKKCSKGNSLKLICKDLKISLNEVMAFGDNDNDLDMLLNVKYGVAMKNAKESIKNNIKEITKLSNFEAGVGNYLEEFFKL